MVLSAVEAAGFVWVVFGGDGLVGEGLCGLLVSSVIESVDEVGFVLCLMMRYDTIQLSVRRSRQAGSSG